MGATSVALVVLCVGGCAVGCVIAMCFAPRQRLSLSDAGACGLLHWRRGDAVMLVVRTLVAVWAVAVLVPLWLEAGAFHMTFFTIWSFTLLAAYFLSAAGASAAHLRHKLRARRPLSSRGAAEGDWVTQSSTVPAAAALAAGETRGSAWARFNQLLLTTVAASALMLDVVLWGLLLPTDPDKLKSAELNFDSYNMHGLNIVAVTVELALNAIPLRIYDLPTAVLWPVAFSAFTLLRVAADSSIRRCLVENVGEICKTSRDGLHMVWPYFFMDTSKPFAAAWYAGMALLFVGAYSCLFAIWRATKRPVLERAAAATARVVNDGSCP
mmetsp:Transcript_117805/g.329885  ORF Transcript_117805/g.329885 Transcript_117805/m.329885 type:complete len:325 (+) Transcript_117805:1-975(+)